MTLKMMLLRRLYCLATILCLFQADYSSAAIFPKQGGHHAALFSSSRPKNKTTQTKITGFENAIKIITSSAVAALNVRGGGETVVAASMAANTFAGLHIVNGFLHYLFPGHVVAAQGEGYYYKPLQGQDPLVRILIQSQGEFGK